MPKQPRTRVPALATPSAPPPGGSPDENASDDGGTFEFLPNFEHEGLDRFRDSGDMAALHDASFNDWEWVIYRLRSPREMTDLQTRIQRVLIAKITGPLDVTHVQSLCGGGVFEFRGFLQNILRTRFTQELAGPPKHYAALAPTIATPASMASTPAPVAVVSDPERRMLRLIRMQRRQIAELAASVQQLAARPATPAPSAGMDLAALIEVADRLNARANPHPEANVLNQVVDAFQKGMDMRAALEGQPESSTVDKLIDKGMPAVERLLGTLLAPRMRPRAAAAPAPVPPPSSAVVVETAPEPPAATAPAAAEADDGRHRWATAIEALARAIAENDDPADFAVTLEAVLQPQEVEILVGSPDEATVAQVRANAGGAFPALNTDAGAAFIAAVLAELRKPA